MSRRAFEDSASSREDLLLNEFLNLAINRFTWSNLPIGLTSERLEDMLITHGTLGAFMENEMLLILPLFGTNRVNVYNEYTNFHLFGFNGQTFTKPIDDIVKLKNNQLGTEDLSTLMLYAKRIDDIEQTQEVNLFQQNMPKIIATDRDGVLTVKAILKKIKDFKYAIITNSNAMKGIKKDNVLDTSSPYILDKLGDYENFYRNKVLTFLGINNGNTDKKERLIVDEVNANNDYISISLDLMYDMRNKFCIEVNAKFGTNIIVEKREVEENVYTNDTESSGE